MRLKKTSFVLFGILSVLFIFGFMSLVSSGTPEILSEGNITSCGIINESGIYNLTSDLIANLTLEGSGDEPNITLCFMVNATENVTLNLQGKNISANETLQNESVGILIINSTNITINGQGGFIKDFNWADADGYDASTGAGIVDTTNISINNVSFDNNADGLVVFGSSNLSIMDNNFTNNDIGILIIGNAEESIIDFHNLNETNTFEDNGENIRLLFLQQGEINSCGMIGMPGTYTLNESINIEGDAESCINIFDVNDVILNLDGFNITGEGSLNKTGISIFNSNNVTIDGQGGYIKGFNYSNDNAFNIGIFLGNSTNTSIINTSIHNNTDGVNVYQSQNINISNNSFTIYERGISIFGDPHENVINFDDLERDNYFDSSGVNVSYNLIFSGDSCGTINEPGVYNLTQNINYTGESEFCIDINSDDVILNLEGNNISGVGIENITGINVDFSNNVTINGQGGYVKNFSKGVIFYNSTNTSIINTSIHNNTQGIFVLESQNINISNNNLTFNQIGIMVLENPSLVNDVHDENYFENNDIDLIQEINGVYKINRDFEIPGFDSSVPLEIYSEYHHISGSINVTFLEEWNLILNEGVNETVVSIPENTVMDRYDYNGTMELDMFSMSDVNISKFSNVGHINDVLAGLEFGIPYMGLNFSDNIKINISVQQGVEEGDVIDIYRSTDGNYWKQKGLVNKTCNITDDNRCIFESSKASYFAVGEDIINFDGYVYRPENQPLENVTVSVNPFYYNGTDLDAVSALSNESGYFNVEDITIPSTGGCYYVDMKKWNGSVLEYIGISNLIKLCGNESIFRFSGTDFQLSDAVTFNVTAVNESGPINFSMFSVKDYLFDDRFINHHPEMGEGYFDNSSNFTFYGIQDRKYVIETDAVGMPAMISKFVSTSYIAENMDNETRQVDITLNFSNEKKYISGYAEVDGLANFTNFSVMYQELDENNKLMPSGRKDYDGTYNASTGFYNFSIDHSTNYNQDFMLFISAFNQSGDETYYGAIRNITLEVEGGNLSISNTSLKPLLGETSELELHNNKTIDTVLKKFQFVDDNGTIIETGESYHINIKMNYSKIWDDSKEINWLKFEAEWCSNTDNSSFEIPVFGTEGVYMDVGVHGYVPRRVILTENILNNNETFNITLYDHERILDDPNMTYGLSEDFQLTALKGDNANNLDYDSEDILLEGEGINVINQILSIVGGNTSFRMEHWNTGLIVHYSNVEVSFNYGAPDTLASIEPDTDEDEDFFTSLWKFGSSGPDNYENVRISVPYDDSKGSDIVLKIPVLYDEDFSVLWNASEDSVEDISNNDDLSGFRTYLESGYEAYLNDTGVECIENNEDLTGGLCHKDGNVLWFEIPHFSAIGAEVIQTGAEEEEEEEEGNRVTNGDGGGGGGDILGGVPSDSEKEDETTDEVDEEPTPETETETEATDEVDEETTDDLIEDEKELKRNLWFLLILTLVLIATGVGYYLYKQKRN